NPLDLKDIRAHRAADSVSPIFPLMSLPSILLIPGRRSPAASLYAGELQVKEVCLSVQRKPRVRLKQVWWHADAASRRRVNTIRHSIKTVYWACCDPRWRMVPPNHPIAGRGEDGSIERPWVGLHLSGDLRHAREKGAGPRISLPNSNEQAAIAGLPI